MSVHPLEGTLSTPASNSTANSTVSNVVGSKTDTHLGDSLYAKVHTLDEHAHSGCKVIPTGAPGVTLTANATAWTLGSFGTVVATNAIASVFDIHFINIEAMSDNATYEIVLYAGADASEAEIGRVRVTRTTNHVKKDGVVFQCPLQPANTQIKGKVMSSSSSADTATISLYYHTY